jgi:hypothetical protein
MTGMTLRRTYAACRKSWRERTSQRTCPLIRLPAPVIPVRKAIRHGVSGEQRLSSDDQRDFDRYYAEWVEDTRANDRDRVAKDAGYLQAIMARNGIPADVPFDHIAAVGVYADTRYSDTTRAWQGRLSADDQREFDKHCANWLEDTRRNDRDDIDKDARRMQDIMAQNNIPANVPYDLIASPDAGRYH